MELNGIEWNGIEWNGMEWNGIEWIIAISMFRNDLLYWTSI